MGARAVDLDLKHEGPHHTAPAGPRAPAAGLRATRYIRLLDEKRLLDKPGDESKLLEEYLFKKPGD